MIERSEPLGGKRKCVQIVSVSIIVVTMAMASGYLVELTRKAGNVSMSLCTKEMSEALLRVIQMWIKPGTTIISDCWKAVLEQKDTGEMLYQTYHPLTLGNTIFLHI